MSVADIEAELRRRREAADGVLGGGVGDRYPATLDAGEEGMK